MKCDNKPSVNITNAVIMVNSSLTTECTLLKWPALRVEGRLIEMGGRNARQRCSYIEVSLSGVIWLALALMWIKMESLFLRFLQRSKAPQKEVPNT